MIKQSLSFITVFFLLFASSAIAQTVSKTKPDELLFKRSSYENDLLPENSRLSRANYRIQTVKTERNGRIVSDVTGPDRAFSAGNGSGSDCDIGCENVIDIFYLARFTSIYGNVNEYDPYFDLNKDGVIDIFDLAIIAGKFGTVFRKK